MKYDHFHMTFIDFSLVYIIMGSTINCLIINNVCISIGSLNIILYKENYVTTCKYRLGIDLNIDLNCVLVFSIMTYQLPQYGTDIMYNMINYL